MPSLSERRLACAPKRALAQAQAAQRRPAAGCTHATPKNFRPGEALQIELLPEIKGLDIKSIRLQYRHINQAERWVACEMKPDGGRFTAAIPAEYTRSRFPLQYYFEIDRGAAGLALYPGLNEDLANQPYFVVRRS